MSSAAPRSRIIDDKSPLCIPFIQDRLAAYERRQQQQQEQEQEQDQEQEQTQEQTQHKSNRRCRRPFFIGLNGVQGIGKTTLVRTLSTTLRDAGVDALVLSIDDFYLPRGAQVALAASQPDNALVQVRGEPGTHDAALLRDVFAALARNDPAEPARLPAYDKAAFAGAGDRVAAERPEQWESTATRDVRVVILEGWCVGFRALPDAEVEARWRGPSRTLRKHRLEHLLFVNDALRGYDAVTDLFDAFVHIDAADTAWVYDWRREQEEALRRERGQGMTDEQVARFVDAYYPAYELYSDGVRAGVFKGRADRVGCQLRLVVDKNRAVQEKIII